MDRRERTEVPMTEILIEMLAGWQAGIWTTMPAIIDSVNWAKRTCVAHPTVMGRFKQPNGTYKIVSMPQCLDVPIIFPQGGGYLLTFPVSPGDECLLFFASRCIDSWWQSGGVQVPAEWRMHSLSDGFAFVGVDSVPNVAPAISAGTVQLRNRAGTAYYEINGTTINVITPGPVNVNAGGNVSVTSGGNASITATGTATIKAASIKLQNAGSALKKLVNDAFISFFNTHTHGGVMAGSSSTAVPDQTAGSGQETSVVTAE